MAIRGPQQPPKPHDTLPVSPRRQEPTSPLQRLVDFGAARTPVEAKKLVSELLASFRAAGFPVAKAGSAEAELGQALKLFQKDQGLPQTGVLDTATHDALKDAGFMPADAGAAQQLQKPAEAPARFDLGARPKLVGGGELGLPKGGDVPAGAQSAQAVELGQLVDKVAKDKPPEVDLKSFVASLRASGFAGQGKGAEQLKDALKKLQKAEGLPLTGQIDPKTAEALVRRGIVDARALPVTAAPVTTAASVTTVGKEQPVENSRTPAQDASKDPTMQGAVRGDVDATQGRGDAAREGAGKDGVGGPGSGQGQASAAADGKSAGSAVGDVEDPWSRGTDGNAPAGDEDTDDERRGHANIVDDAFEHPEGHWQVISLSEQIAAGLAAIVRDDDGTGAATYAWDFTLYRPGVYGKKQPAEKLFHLVVGKAGAFDALWEQARAALNEKLAALEPESARVLVDDFRQALRVARYRVVEDAGP